MDNKYGCLSLVLTVVILAILMPLLNWACGYITGLILKWLIGDTVVYGLNYLFNTTRFTSDMLPVACGALGVVGSFFKSASASSTSK